MYAEDSIEMLAASGVDFDQHQRRGIDVREFAALLTTSGLVLNEDVKWISFHSAYDFAYLLKILTDKPLPKTEHELFELLRSYFPAFYDVKFVMKYCDALNGGLDKIAEILKIERIGPSHTAGSDSLLTAAIFYEIRKHYFQDYFDDSQYLNVLYGLGQTFRAVKEKKNKKIKKKKTTKEVAKSDGRKLSG